MMDQKRLIKIFQDTLVSWKTELLIGCILFCVDFSLSQPLYRDVLDLQEFAWALSFGMALLIAVLAKVCSKLLARGWITLAVVGMVLFLGLVTFIFFGQEAVAEMQANYPMNVFLGEGAAPVEQSNRHYIATGLMVVLFSLSVLIGYLVHQNEEDVKGIAQRLSMSSLARWFQSKIIVLQGKYDRALAKPTHVAEERVNERMQKLQNNLNEYERTEHRLKGEQNYQLQLLDLLHAQTISAIKAIYNKKSFFKSLFS